MKTRSLATLCAIALLPLTALRATTTSYNTGSLGAAANGTNADPVTFGAGAVTAGGDQAAYYNAPGVSTSVPFQSALNPGAASPFSIEYWAFPTGSDNDDAPVSNRVATGNRSGWVFFQRDAATGWNFRMYNGAGSALGWDLTGGSATLNAWTQVVATWDGSAALLFVNGALADNTNAGGLNGVYNPRTTATLFAAATDTGSPYNGGVDEIAFYPSALTQAQILSHFNAASSATPGFYHNMVQADGARLQLSNNAVPEPASLTILGLSSMALLRRRRCR